MTAPATLKGFPDLGVDMDWFGQVYDLLLEQSPKLLFPNSIRVYAKMRRDPQIGSVLRAYGLAINRGTWTVDGAGCRDEVTQQIADDFGLPIKGYRIGEPDPDNPDEKVSRPTGASRRRFTWDRHVRVASSLSNAFGFAAFAQQWDDTAGRWRLGMVQERMPQTITQFRANPDGTLAGVVQDAPVGAVAPMIQTANHELVMYGREVEGTNFAGVSLIREAYIPWLIADQMMSLWPESVRKFAMGVPYIEDQPGATPQQSAENARAVQGIRAGSRTGGSVPNGAKLHWQGLTGNVPDPAELITFCHRLITRNMMASILDMATAERGNRSLGETVMALLVFAQQAEGQRIADDATTQMVVPLVDANWGEDEPAPRISVTGIGRDKQLTAQDMNVLLQFGGLTPDDVLEADTRASYGLPPIDLATRRLENTTTDPNAPTPATEGGPDA